MSERKHRPRKFKSVRGWVSQVAKWAWEGRGKGLPVDNGKNRGILVLRKLGTYDGLRKGWTPASRKGKQ